MSAFLSSQDTIRALATFWEESLLRSRYGTPRDELARAIGCAATEAGNSWPYDTASRAYKLISLAGGSPAGAVFELLLAENVASLQARYPDSPEMWQAADGYRYAVSYMARRWLNTNRCGQLVGLVRGFSYQACEHRSWRQSVGYQLILQIKDQLLAQFEQRDAISENDRLWAEWSEPEASEPQPVRLSALLS